MIKTEVALTEAQAQTLQEIAACEGVSVEEVIRRSIDKYMHERKQVSQAMNQQTLQQARDAILKLAHQHGASNVRVFGSVVRGEASADSDLDLLVEFEPGRGLLDRIGLKHDLEDLLDIPVDVITEKNLYPHVRRSVLEQVRPL